MNRQEMISRILDRTEPCDMLVIGGGATGVGIAVDDFIARRTRCLFLNAHAARLAAAKVASLMATELEKDSQWESEQVESFQRMGVKYLPDI